MKSVKYASRFFILSLLLILSSIAAQPNGYLSDHAAAPAGNVGAAANGGVANGGVANGGAANVDAANNANAANAIVIAPQHVYAVNPREDEQPGDAHGLLPEDDVDLAAQQAGAVPGARIVQVFALFAEEGADAQLVNAVECDAGGESFLLQRTGPGAYARIDFTHYVD